MFMRHRCATFLAAVAATAGAGVVTQEYNFVVSGFTGDNEANAPINAFFRITLADDLFANEARFEAEDVRLDSLSISGVPVGFDETTTLADVGFNRGRIVYIIIGGELNGADGLAPATDDFLAFLNFREGNSTFTLTRSDSPEVIGSTDVNFSRIPAPAATAALAALALAATRRRR